MSKFQPRHWQALKETRHALMLDSTERLVFQIVVAVMGLAILFFVGGHEQGWPEFLARSAAAAAIVLYFPAVYVCKLISASNAEQRKRLLAVTLMILGVVIILSGLTITVIGFVEYRNTPTSTHASPPRVIVQRPIPEKLETPRGRKTFDYSTNNGIVSIGDRNCKFKLKFSKASDTAIYMYTFKNNRRTNIKHLARVKAAEPGAILKIENFDFSSDHYQISLGEHFLAENTGGYFMQGKIISIQDDSRGHTHDEVVFDFEINADGTAEFQAI